ncbi:hypothetical protein POTOM_035018 [Populus tomentosa]|uniref:Uncharacterized protein n=1 Tax=Populus tomentosa TaxID=118781 RepID=A0A8X7ZEE8_POPTO|nr:hypothetical protein POTOM_035018 [Populus tomentosa]
MMDTSSDFSVLTKKGEAQAKTASRQMLLDDSFDVCFSSPLIRSKRTAEIIWGFVIGLKERKKRRLEMANWASAGRSTSNMMRAALRATNKSASPTARVYLSQFSSTIRLPNLTLHCHSRISSSRLVRRELSSLLPVHSAIASACLVSKLPSEVSTSSEVLRIFRYWEGSMMQRSKAYPGNKDECLNPDFDDQVLPFAYPLVTSIDLEKVDLLIISVPSSASACSGKERIVERQSVFSKLKFKFPEVNC